jgi:hypothetical protein
MTATFKSTVCVLVCKSVRILMILAPDKLVVIIGSAEIAEKPTGGEI